MCHLPDDYKLLLAGPLKPEGQEYFELLKKFVDEKNLSKESIFKQALYIISMNI